ncbi:MAG: CpsD/CapB family tyrosine-protein kinase [Planctomycetota bacterium]|jgi:capsular exopolysaccharide synthesis family protein
MSNFEVAFDQALAKTSAAPLSEEKRRQVGTAPLEKAFHTVEHFDFDPTRLVVSTTVVGEQYRTLKANLDHFRSLNSIGSIVFSSSVKGEGKTTAVVNIAREFGHERGAKIAVVDCDFKRPGIGRFCKVECQAGIEEVFAGGAKLEDCGIYSRRDNFAIFPVKSRPTETGQLLASEAVSRVLGELEAVFDLVILDTSPVLSTSEPLILGAKAGGVVLVVLANSTQRESVLFAQGQLEQAGCRLLGLVLNARPSYVPRFWLLRKYEYFPDAYRYKAD